MDERYRWTLAGAGLVLMALSGIWMLVHPTALRDESSCDPRPYSYSRVQLWWWTFVILPAWLVAWAVYDELWQFNSTALALLGLGGATTVAARLIDGRDESQTKVTRHQDENGSKGFFIDILSDSQGVSMHRYQGLVFNVVYAFSFLISTFDGRRKFYDFDPATLALLGVSTATYIAIKATENRPSSGATAPRSDELLDPGAHDDNVTEGERRVS